MTKQQAIEAVEKAPWDECGSGLQGSDIWGVRGQFAAPRAVSNYTYEQALAEAEKVA